MKIKLEARLEGGPGRFPLTSGQKDASENGLGGG